MPAQELMGAAWEWVVLTGEQAKQTGIDDRIFPPVQAKDDLQNKLTSELEISPWADGAHYFGLLIPCTVLSRREKNAEQQYLDRPINNENSSWKAADN